MGGTVIENYSRGYGVSRAKFQKENVKQNIRISIWPWRGSIQELTNRSSGGFFFANPDGSLGDKNVKVITKMLSILSSLAEFISLVFWMGGLEPSS